MESIGANVFFDGVTWRGCVDAHVYQFTSEKKAFWLQKWIGIIGKSKIKPLVWKRYIDEVFFLWDTNEGNIKEFVKRANNYHVTIKFTAEISDSEIAFLDTKVYKGERFNRDSTLDVQTHYKQTETF